MDTASISRANPAPAKPSSAAVRRTGKTALRWIAGVSVLALLAATGFGVANAFADMARQDALAGAYQEASADAARAAGGNPGPDWATLLEAPAGRRSLALWFDTMRSQWPSACADRMAEVSQSSVACLPDSGFLQALIDARLGAHSYQALADNAAATALERAATLAATTQPIAARTPDLIEADPVVTDTPARRAAEALREDAADPSDDAFLGAYEPPTSPAMTLAPPAVEAAPVQELEPLDLEVAPIPVEAPRLEVEPPPFAGPTFNPDEPVAANSSALLGAPVLNAATLALVTP